MAKIIGNVVGMPSPPQEVGVVDWDFYQMNGNRTSYPYAFVEIWDDENFAPDYDIAPVGDARGMFYGSKIKDLKGILERRGRKLDTSKVTYFTQAFFNSSVTHLPEISLEGINVTEGAIAMFALCRSLISVEMLRTSKKFSILLTNIFAQCSSLTHLRVDRINTDFNVQFSPLDPESTKDVIKHLVNHNGDSFEYAYTVTFKKTSFEALEAEGLTEEDIDWLQTQFPKLDRETIEFFMDSWELVIDFLRWNLNLV